MTLDLNNTQPTKGALRPYTSQRDQNTTQKENKITF